MANPARYILPVCLLLLASLAHAQSIQVSAVASPSSVRPGASFQVTVVVIQWVPGAANVPEPTIGWPDWKALGIAEVREDTRSHSSMPMGDQAMASTSVVMGLTTGEPGTIEIPAMTVTGSAGSATTSPLTVTVDASAAAPAPPAPAAPAAPQGMPAPPPATTGMPPWWQDPALTQPPQPVVPDVAGEEDPWTRVQYSAGAFAGMIALIITVVKLAQSGRRPTP